MTIGSARNRLLTVWLIGTGSLFIIVGWLATVGKYGTEWQDRIAVFSWLSPMIVPILMLMITVMPLRHTETSEKVIDNAFVVHLAVWVSVFYLLAIAAVLVWIDTVVPLNFQSLFKFATLPLSIIQAAAMAFIGKFFVSNL